MTDNTIILQKLNEFNTILVNLSKEISILSKELNNLKSTKEPTGAQCVVKLCHSCPSKRLPFIECHKCKRETCEGCLRSSFDGYSYCYICYNR